MAVFVVTTTIPTREGFVWFPFEVPGINTVEEFTKRIVADGVISGTKYERLRRVRDEIGGGEPRYRKEPFALGRHMLGTLKISPETAHRELEARVA